MLTIETNAPLDFEVFWEPDSQTGFIPKEIPASPADLSAVSDAGLRLAAAIAPRLGSLTDSELSSFVASLPDSSGLTLTQLSAAQREGAVRAYVNIAAHLIHRPAFSPLRQLPAAIAKPLWQLSASVNRPPSLTYASYVLANFTNAIRPFMPAAEIEVAQTPTGTSDEEWFVAVHLAVETAGGPIVAAIRTIEQALAERDDEPAIRALGQIEGSLLFAIDTLPVIQERLSPEIFRNQIRPLLYGHDQIKFTGVPGDPMVTYIGETGAQSGAIRAADALLGTKHAAATETAMNRFLSCAPPAHQRFCSAAAALGARLDATVQSPQVRRARRSALEALVEFRRVHLQVVANFLTPAGNVLATRGTGGTNFAEWLRQLVDETEREVDEAR